MINIVNKIEIVLITIFLIKYWLINNYIVPFEFENIWDILNKIYYELYQNIILQKTSNITTYYARYCKLFKEKKSKQIEKLKYHRDI